MGYRGKVSTTICNCSSLHFARMRIEKKDFIHSCGMTKRAEAHEDRFREALDHRRLWVDLAWQAKSYLRLQNSGGHGLPYLYAIHTSIGIECRQVSHFPIQVRGTYGTLRFSYMQRIIVATQPVCEMCCLADLELVNEVWCTIGYSNIHGVCVACILYALATDKETGIDEAVIHSPCRRVIPEADPRPK